MQSSIDKRWSQFKIWQVLIPVLIFVFTWVIALLILNLENAFIIVYSKGDIVLFSALLLIGLSTNLKQYETSEFNIFGNFKTKLEYALGFGVVLMFWYGALRVFSLSNNFNPKSLPPKSWEITLLNISICFFALVYCMLIFWKTKEKLLERSSSAD